jgi:hypothetical protein
LNGKRACWMLCAQREAMPAGAAPLLLLPAMGRVTVMRAMAVPVVAVRVPLEPVLILPAIIAMTIVIITAVITAITLVVLATTLATTAVTTARATCYHLQLLIIQLYEKCYVLHFFLTSCSWLQAVLDNGHCSI